MTKIKVCGIKNPGEAKSVCEAEFNGRKVDYLGLIFASSKRQISLKNAEGIAKTARIFGVKVVGVFAKMPTEAVINIAKILRLDAIQNYEIVEDKSIFPCPVWQVFSVGEEFPEITGDFDMPFFDAKGENLGGNGVNFNWELIHDFCQNSPKIKESGFGLAGGIGVENFKDALALNPAVIDINSKIEDEMGLKRRNLVYEILKLRGGDE